MNQERRRHARVKLGVDVDVSSGSNFFVGRARDLSMGGLFIETPVPLPIGTTVALELILCGRKHTLLAEAMWVLGGPEGTTEGVGVRFTELPSRTHAAILGFMRQRAPVEFEMFAPEPLGAPVGALETGSR